MSNIYNSDTISKHLEVGGNVLLPVDTAGRVLELLLILEQVGGSVLNVFCFWLVLSAIYM